jgi:hypothetical protein
MSELQQQDALRGKVHALEAQMLTLPQLDLRVVHYFAQGVYARELHIPKGTILTGAIHKYPNLNIMSQGELTVLTEEGPVRVKAPFTIVSPAGTKRVAYAHEDTIWTTVFGTQETDPDKIVDHFTTASEQEFLEHRAQLLLHKD